MSFVVTRQHYYYSGERLVEVTEGGLDCAGPDALNGNFRGEFECYDDPREAVRVAIEIAEAWKACQGLTCRGQLAGEFGMEGESMTADEAVAWAEAVYERLDKCACGTPLPEKRKRWYAFDLDGDEFCSERCADRAIELSEELRLEESA